MSSNKITIELEDRKETRKEVRALRAEGVLPGVINEPNVDSKNVAVTLREFKKVYSAAGRTQPIEFSLGSKKHLGMIKEIDRDPVLGELIHFTIQSIKADEVVAAEIPVRLDEEVEVLVHAGLQAERPDDPWREVLLCRLDVSLGKLEGAFQQRLAKCS